MRCLLMLQMEIASVGVSYPYESVIFGMSYAFKQKLIDVCWQ